MGRVRSPYVRSRVRWYRRLLLDPAALRYWLVVAALGIVLAAVVASTLGRAAAARARWGDTTTVWVTTVAVGVGDELAGSVERTTWPEALAPPGAVADLDADARSALAVGPGQVVTESALDPSSGPAVRAGRRTVAVPRGEAPLPVAEGERVDLWGVVAAGPVADGADPTTRLAVAAVVTAVGERSVTVAVEPDEVGPVAAAAAVSAVALVGRP